jgi:hypothetical protein
MAPLAQNDSSVTFWPWGRRSAVAASGLLLLILVGGVALLRIAADWPAARWEAAFVLAAVLLSLVPIGLLVLASVAQSQGSVSFRGVSLNFGATAQAVAASAATSTISIPRNVADEGVNIADSGHSEVLSVLRKASRADIVVVDLEDGHAWWDSRLLLLCAGAERQGRPRAVVFVGTVDRQDRRFVGWANPADVVQQMLKADREFEFAYAQAQTSMRRAELTFPAKAQQPNEYPNLVPALPAPAGVPQGIPVVSDHELFEPNADMLLPQPPAMAFSRALARTVAPRENSGNVGQLSVLRLRELLTPVLHTEHIEETAPDDAWVSAVVNLDSDYLVVTAGGAYVGLAPQAHLQRAILSAIVASLTAASSPAPSPSSAAGRVPAQTRREAPTDSPLPETAPNPSIWTSDQQPTT